MAETLPTPLLPPPSSLLDYLPGIYREDPYLGQFLLAFEQILLGRKDKYTLELIFVEKIEKIPDKGISKIIVALVDAALHIRIFDANGIRVVDKPEGKLMSDGGLTWLKTQIKLVRNNTGLLSMEEQQKTIQAAALVAGYSLLGLEESIAEIADLFDPLKTPEEFLPWLAGWVAFNTWSDVSEEKQRDFIVNMMELYRWRGTEKNLKQLFLIFTGREPVLPVITDNLEAYGYDLSLKVVTTTDDIVVKGRSLVIVALVGTDLHIRIFDADGNQVVDKSENKLDRGNVLTKLKEQLTPIPNESSLSKEVKQKIIEDATLITGHIQTHYFKVLLDLSELVRSNAQTEIDRQIEIAHALIHLEKPAHTRYTLDLVFPSFRIGGLVASGQANDFTQVGKNTRLGVAQWSK